MRRRTNYSRPPRTTCLRSGAASVGCFGCSITLTIMPRRVLDLISSTVQPSLANSPTPRISPMSFAFAAVTARASGETNLCMAAMAEMNGAILLPGMRKARTDRAERLITG
jgi:hypothetical protein